MESPVVPSPAPTPRVLPPVRDDARTRVDLASPALAEASLPAAPPAASAPEDAAPRKGRDTAPPGSLPMESAESRLATVRAMSAFADGEAAGLDRPWAPTLQMMPAVHLAVPAAGPGHAAARSARLREVLETPAAAPAKPLVSAAITEAMLPAIPSTPLPSSPAPVVSAALAPPVPPPPPLVAAAEEEPESSLRAVLTSPRHVAALAGFCAAAVLVGVLLGLAVVRTTQPSPGATPVAGSSPR